MKKVITVFILIILFLFISKCIMVWIDKNNINSINEDVYNNTKIENIRYVNEYDNYYLVMDYNFLYLFNSDYDEISKIELIKLHKNNADYELVYRDKMIMYMDNYKSKKGLVFKYYDIYTYELIDEVVVGG